MTRALLLMGAALLLGASLHVAPVRADEPGPVNCASAKLPAEKAICASEDLVLLDADLHRAYRAARVRWTASLSNSIRVAHLEWLKSRNQCGGNARCLRERIVQQIAELDKQRPDSPTWILDIDKKK